MNSSLSGLNWAEGCPDPAPPYRKNSPKAQEARAMPKVAQQKWDSHPERAPASQPGSEVLQTWKRKGREAVYTRLLTE